MRLTGLGKLVVFILIVGVAVGGWRWWQGQSGGAGGAGGGNTGGAVASNGKAGNNKGIVDRVKDIFSGGQGGTTTGGATTGGGNAQPGDILLVTTPAKQGWLQSMVDRFNASSGGKHRVVLYQSPHGKPGMPSRDAMQAILAGSLKPVLWSPGNPMITQRLAEVWAERKGGDPIIDMTDPNGYRTFLRSPMVFLTTKEKARFLRPHLSGRDPWSALREISTGSRRPPWGSLRWSHADPQTSSSGLATVGLILLEYAAKTGQSDDLAKLATSKGFITFLGGVERGLVYDKPAVDGTTALTKAFVEDPSRYDLITAYEGTVLKSIETNPNLAVIYPGPTSVSEHAVSLLNGSWISPQQREGALEFIKFLGSREAIQAGMEDRFRPVGATGDLSLNLYLNRYGDNGFRTSFTTTDLPPYLAINAATYIWAQQIAPRQKR